MFSIAECIASIVMNCDILQQRQNIRQILNVYLSDLSEYCTNQQSTISTYNTEQIELFYNAFCSPI